VRNFLQLLLRLLPSPKSVSGFWGYALFVLSPVLTVVVLLGHADLIADNIDWIEYALRTWWVYPLLMAFGFALLVYAGYKHQPAQQTQATPPTPPLDTDSRQEQESQRLQEENEQLKQEKHELEGEEQRLEQENHEQKTRGLPMEKVAARHMHHCSFRLMDLVDVAGENNVLQGFRFETCTMEGPGIITISPPPAKEDTVSTSGGGRTAFGGFYASGFGKELRFEGGEDSVFYEIPSGGTNANGVIHLPGCHFHQVTFRGIGVAGTPAELELWRRAFTPL